MPAKRGNAQRVVERGRGCWNCTHYDTGEMTQKRWQECKLRDIGVIAASLGKSPFMVTDQEMGLLTQMDHSVKIGHAGICLLGKPNSDFVDHRYLCDGWTGKQGASLATEGHKLDMLPEELKDRIDGDK